jgi:hypothetical protein
LKHPARFQLNKAVMLHQELCKATHFGDIDKNRSSWYPEKGTNMRVIQTAKRCHAKPKGSTGSSTQNHRIATDDKTVEFRKKKTTKKK